MYCSKCGNKIDKSSLFCNVCGSNVENCAEEKNIRTLIFDLIEKELQIKGHISDWNGVLNEIEKNSTAKRKIVRICKKIAEFIERYEFVCSICEKFRYTVCLLVDCEESIPPKPYDAEIVAECLLKLEEVLNEIEKCIVMISDIKGIVDISEIDTRLNVDDVIFVLAETEKLFRKFYIYVNGIKRYLQKEEKASVYKNIEEKQDEAYVRCNMPQKSGGVFKKLSSLFEKKEKKMKASPNVKAQAPVMNRVSDGNGANNSVSYGVDFGTCYSACFSSDYSGNATVILNDNASEKAHDMDLGVAPVELSEVQFSAVVKKKAEISEYIPVNIIMYEDEFRRIVDEQLDEEFKEVKGGYHNVEKKSKVKVVLSSKDIELNDCEEEGIWQGKFLEFSFIAEVPEDYAKKQILFCASVYINDLIATKLKFIVDVKKEEEHKVEIEREDITSAFVSYASQDRDRVAAIIQGMKKARPDLDVFFDVETLRSGEKWEEALKTEIDKRKILYLCWSKFASQSQWVDFEWRYALDKKGEDCIDPIPIEPPEICPPPLELSAKHFNDRMIYVIKALEYINREMAQIILKETNEKICVNKNSFVIGRIKDRVDFVVTNTTVSRIHAEIICENNEYFIVDFNSANKTYVDGVECRPEEKIPLRDGVEIKLGNVEMIFKLPEKA